MEHSFLVNPVHNVLKLYFRYLEQKNGRRVQGPPDSPLELPRILLASYGATEIRESC